MTEARMPDPDFTEPVLDLGAEELVPIARRYRSNEVPEPAVAAPLALLVGRPSEELEPLATTLLADGWEVWTCEGPEARTCPLAAGEHCVPRERAAVTVMYMDPNAPAALSLPRIACAAKGEKPSVVALEGRIDSPRANGMHAIIGALRGTEAIARAAQELR